MPNKVLVATKQEYALLRKSGVDMSDIDRVVFITPKQAEEFFGAEFVDEDTSEEVLSDADSTNDSDQKD